MFNNCCFFLVARNERFYEYFRKSLLLTINYGCVHLVFDIIFRSWTLYNCWYNIIPHSFKGRIINVSSKLKVENGAGT